MDLKRKTSSVWPYVLVGSAVGGAVAYLFTTESGRKVRRSIGRPSELADNLEEARGYFERKTRVVTDQVRNVLDKAKEGMEAGQRAFNEADQKFRAHIQKLEGKNDQVASNVHKAVDNMSRTASTIERSILDPVYEVGALYRGIECGIRTLLGHKPRAGRLRTMPTSY